MRIVWSPTARRRAQAAVDSIALDRPQTSLEWLDGMVRRVELLRDLPEQGREVPEWHEPTVREVFHELSHFRQELPPRRSRGSS